MRALLPLIAFSLCPFFTWGQSPIWTDAFKINNAGQAQTADFKKDNAGNFYHTGLFSSSVSFKNETVTSKGSNDVYIVKSTKAGDVTWAVSLGGNSFDDVQDMAIDDSANVYVTGRFFRQFIAGNDTITTSGFSGSAYLTKIDSSGNIIWTKTATGTGNQQGKAIATDGKGFIYWAGDFTGSTNVLGKTVTGGSGFSTDVYFAKIGSTGKLVRVESYGGNSVDQVRAVAVQGKTVFITGIFFGNSFKIGSTTISSSGNYDIFLARMDTAFSKSWLIKGGGLGSDQVTDMHANKDGSVSLVGPITAGFTMGSKTIAGSWGNNFVARIGTNRRATILSRIQGNTGFGQNVYPTGVVGLDNGTVMVCGYFNGSLSVGNKSFSASTSNAFVLQIKTNSTLDWLNQGGGNNNDICSGIEVDSNGLYYIGGYFNRASKFGNTSISGTGNFINYVATGTPPIVAPKYNGLRNRVVYVDSTFNRSYAVKPTTDAKYTLVNGPTGMVLDSDNGNLTFLPNVSQLGKHKIIIEAENIAGKARDSFVLEVIYPLNAQLNLPEFACLDQDITFFQSIDNMGPLVIEFEFGDGSKRLVQAPIDKAYSDTGTYVIRMAVTNFVGVKDTAYDTIYIAPSPIADFNIETACKGDSIQLLNTSDVGIGSITNAVWEKDGSVVSNNLDYTGFALDFDTNKYELFAISNYGCIDSVTKKVIIRGKPSAGFSTFNACAGDDALFFDNSSSIDDKIVAYQWNFGNGKSRKVSFPGITFKYDTGGTFRPELIVVTENGCKDTFKARLTVFDKPEAQFQIDNICFGESISLVDQSTTPVGTISQRRWTTGDNRSYSQANVNHTYKSSGKYDVTLITVNSSGCTDTLTNSIIVASKAKAKISASKACQGSLISLTDSSSKGINDSWLPNKWFQSSTEIGSGMLLSTKVDSTETTFKLVVETQAGCKDSIETIITPLAPVKAKFSINSGCEGDTLKINEEFETTQLERVVWVGLGMETISNDSFWQVVYQPNEKHQLFARTIAKNGCQDSAVFDAFEVYNTPNGGFSYTIDTPSKTVSFVSLDTVGTGYEWDFDNGFDPTITISKSVSQAFNQNGIYNVSLTAKTDKGCETQTDSTLLIFFTNSIDNSNPITASVYPNPATQFVQIALETNNSLIKWQLTNTNGQEIAYGNTTTVNIANLSEGIYLLKVQTEQGLLVKKIQKL
ncbi:MAG: PKD domain-containing protein [Bacteroidia bacterium]